MSKSNAKELIKKHDIKVIVTVCHIFHLAEIDKSTPLISDPSDPLYKPIALARQKGIPRELTEKESDAEFFRQVYKVALDVPAAIVVDFTPENIIRLEDAGISYRMIVLDQEYYYWMLGKFTADGWRDTYLQYRWLRQWQRMPESLTSPKMIPLNPVLSTFLKPGETVADCIDFILS